MLDGNTYGVNRISIELRNDPERVRVVVAGELDLATTPVLNQVLDHFEREKRDVCIDLDALEFIDSIGITSIYRAWRAADTSGRRLTVRGSSLQVERLFTLTGMREVLPFEE